MLTDPRRSWASAIRRRSGDCDDGAIGAPRIQVNPLRLAARQSHPAQNHGRKILNGLKAASRDLRSRRSLVRATCRVTGLASALASVVLLSLFFGTAANARAASGAGGGTATPGRTCFTGAGESTSVASAAGAGAAMGSGNRSATALFAEGALFATGSSRKR